jgi:transposase
MDTPPDLDQLSEQQVRELAGQLLDQSRQQDETIKRIKQENSDYQRTIQRVQLQNEQYKHELAILKRHRFARKSEVLDKHQRGLLDDLVEEDLAGIEEEMKPAPPAARAEPGSQPKRKPLPPELPRTVIKHEPDSTVCACGCQMTRIGEDISEKLDYIPGTFTVEQHVRGKWACACCETLIQAPVPAQVIDKGVPAPGLLAQVLVAKYGDHLPLNRQQQIFARAGLELARSTLADWVGRCGVALQPLVDALRDALHQQAVLHADETPVAMLKPGNKKTHRAYVWAYTSTPFSELNSVVYDFAPSRSGEHARAFLKGWQGKLVCDDFAGYKASFKEGITEIGCMTHARRKFYDLHIANQSQIAADALEQISQLYDIERQAKDLDDQQRQQLRQEKAKPILDLWHRWLQAQRQKVPDGSATARAIDYSLKRWDALTRYCEDGAVPIDNNRVENQIRPWALGRSNWLFAGSLRSGQRAANVMSLVQSAKMNGHDPYAYLKDVLARLPTQRASQIDELLPHHWQPDVKM